MFGSNLDEFCQNLYTNANVFYFFLTAKGKTHLVFFIKFSCFRDQTIFNNNT